MSLMDFIKKQFIDVIHWTEDAATDADTLAWRFPMQDFEIQHGAQLTVRESQLALFINEGKLADAFGPGLYKLTTQTLPLLTNLKNWDKLFASPFKSDVYFFSARQRLDRKWGTPNPVTIRDKEFGMVRLRTFGIYSYHITDAKLFHTKVSGTVERYSAEQLESQLRNTIVGHISDLFGESGTPFVDMAGNQEEFGQALRTRVEPLFAGLGLALDSLVVQNISLPEELQAVLDQRIGVNMMGGMQAYTQYQVANSIPLAAQNEGGLAGLGAGVGVGLGVGQQVANTMAQTLGGAAPAAPAAAAPVSADEVVATLEKLHGLVEKGILSAAEFEA
ncbi:MAG TPA: SPFH domain-containing protein, partial [Rhodocyclaceae bacterium]